MSHERAQTHSAAAVQPPTVFPVWVAASPFLNSIFLSSGIFQECGKLEPLETHRDYLHVCPGLWMFPTAFLCPQITCVLVEGAGSNAIKTGLPSCLSSMIASEGKLAPSPAVLHVRQTDLHDWEIKFFHRSWFYIIPLKKILMLYSLFCTWNCQLLKIICDRLKKKKTPNPKRFLNEISQKSIFFLNQLKYFNLIMLKFLPSKQ